MPVITAPEPKLNAESVLHDVLGVDLNNWSVVSSPIWWGASRYVRKSYEIKLTHSDLCCMVWLNLLVRGSGLDYAHRGGLIIAMCYAFGYKEGSATRIIKSLIDRGFIEIEKGAKSMRGYRSCGLRLSATGLGVVELFYKTIIDRRDKFVDVFNAAFEHVFEAAKVNNKKGLGKKYAGLGRGSLYLDAQLYK